MHRLLGVLIVMAMGSVHAFEVGAQHAEPLLAEDADLSLTTLRVGADLPWQWRIGGGWLALSRLDATLGRLEGEGESGLAVSVGPGLRLQSPGGNWHARLAFRPTWLERATFGNIDLGGHVQFETSLGVGYWLGEHLCVSYELLHVSNGGLENPNPGWDGQRLGLSYDF